MVKPGAKIRYRAEFPAESWCCVLSEDGKTRHHQVFELPTQIIAWVVDETAGDPVRAPVAAVGSIIGASADCDLAIIGDDRVSARHAGIFPTDSRGYRLFLRPGQKRRQLMPLRGDAPSFVPADFDTTFGTYVNGRRVERVELRDGDELRFGVTRLTFRVASREP